MFSKTKTPCNVQSENTQFLWGLKKLQTFFGTFANLVFRTLTEFLELLLLSSQIFYNYKN